MKEDTEYSENLSRMKELISVAAIHLGEGEGDPDAKLASNLIDEMMKDKFDLPKKPDYFDNVKTIIDKADMDEVLKEGYKNNYDYYFIKFPLDLDMNSDLYFDELTLRADFIEVDGADPPKIFQFSPNDEIIKYVEGNVGMQAETSVGIDLSKLSSQLIFDLIKRTAPIDVNATIKAEGKLNFNFPFSIEKKTVSTSSEGQNFVYWKFMKKITENKIGPFAAIIQTPKDSKEIKIKISVTGTRDVQYIPTFLYRWFKTFTEKDKQVKDFIKAGFPRQLEPPVIWSLPIKQN